VTPDIGDPVALFAHLDASGRFPRDSRLGRVYHRGMVSLRENVTADSLHLVVHGNRVKAHVDGISPLDAEHDGPSRYSARQALQHNLAGMAQDLGRLLRGRQGDHRCELDCVWNAGEAPVSAQADSMHAVRLKARVTGSIDEARLRDAVRASLGDRASQRDPLEVVDCSSDAELEDARHRLHSTTAPLSSPPLQACLAHHPAGDVLMLNLNHAATDGPGALRVLRCIAANYAGDAGRHEVDFLAVSDLPVGPSSTAVSALTRWRMRGVQLLRDLLTRPASIAPDAGAQRSGRGSHQFSVSADDLRPQADAPPPWGRSDVLIAALHLAIGEWNLQHGTPCRRISVLTQADLRPPEFDHGTIANLSVTARMSTGRRDRATPAAAMTAIAAQAARNTSTRTGIALVAALERAGLLALWAKQSIVVLQPLSSNDGVDSSMLCNLGSLEPPSFGPEAGEVVELWFSAPARSSSMLCIGAVTIGGRLHLTLRYPQRLFDAPAAERFAACYLDALRAVIGAAQPTRL
jgi:hypothetical protein